MSDEVTHGFGAAMVPDDGLSEEVDVDLDDNDGTGLSPPPEAAKPANARPSGPAPAAAPVDSKPDKLEAKKARPRMSLRVPDDEVVRPQQSRGPAPTPPELIAAAERAQSRPADVDAKPPSMRVPEPPRVAESSRSNEHVPRSAEVVPQPTRAVEPPPPPPAPPRPRAPSVTSEGKPSIPRPAARSVSSEIVSPPSEVTKVAAPPSEVMKIASPPSEVTKVAPLAVPPPAEGETDVEVEEEIRPARIISVAPEPYDAGGLDAPDDIPTLTDLPAIDLPRDSSADGIPIVEDEPTFELRAKPSEPPPVKAPPPEPVAPAAAAPAPVAPAPVAPAPVVAAPVAPHATPPLAPFAASIFDAPFRPPALTIPEGDGIDIPVDEDPPIGPTSESEVVSDDLLPVETPPRLDEPIAARAPATNGGAKHPVPAVPPVGMSSDVHMSDRVLPHTPPGGIAVPAPPAPTRPAAVPAASAAPAVPPAAAQSSGSAVQQAPPPPPPRAKGKPPLVIVPPHASPLAPQPMTDAAAARKRTRPWWEELFNDDFIRTMAKISDPQIAREVDFIEDSLGVARGAMILDMACGTGRHAIELTRRGYRVVGLDLSLAMLAKAAEEAQERDQKLNFVQGDMREMTFEDMFDGVFCWNTSFGFFEEEKNAGVIQRVHRALRKGGQFVLEVLNRDFAGRQAPSLVWFEGDGCICMDEMQIDWITSRMRVKRTMMMDDGRSREIEYSLRVYSLHELGKMLHDHGFRVAEVSGRIGTPGVFFGSDSPNIMILAEKR